MLQKLVRSAFSGLFIFFAMVNYSVAEESAPTTKPSELVLTLSIHGANIVGKTADLIDQLGGSANQAILYGIGVGMDYFANSRFSVGAGIDKTWWNGEYDLSATSLMLRIKGFLSDRSHSAPYVAIQGGQFSDNINREFRLKLLKEDYHWYTRIGIGVQFVSRKGQLSSIELFYKIVPFNPDDSIYSQSLLSQNPSLNCFGVEFSFGIKL